MKIIVHLSISVKQGRLSALVEAFSSHGCELHKILLSESNSENDTFDLEIVYTDVEKYRQLLDTIEGARALYTIHSINNLLEDQITGGLLTVSGKMPIENQNDYEMKVLGSSALIHEKISAGQAGRYSGISRNIGLLCALRKRLDMPQDLLPVKYVDIEKDAIVLHRFTGLNGIPVIIVYQQNEDLVKTIQGIESTFSAVRILDIEDVEDISIYEYLNSEISMPVLSFRHDEIPLSMLIEISRLLEKNGLVLRDNTIGVIGINVSVLRLTRLLSRLGCPRVLGYDNNEKLMLSFEKSGGLATTPENIFSNSDLILLVKNHFTIDEFNKIRSGQMIISTIDEEDLEKTIINEKGVKEYIPKEHLDTTILFPGILAGMIKSGRKTLSDESILELSKGIQKLYGTGGSRISLFSDIHEKVARII